MLCVSTKNNATASYSTSKCVFHVGMSVIVLVPPTAKSISTPRLAVSGNLSVLQAAMKQANELGQRLHRSWITLLDRNRVQCEFFNPLT